LGAFSVTGKAAAILLLTDKRTENGFAMELALGIQELRAGPLPASHYY
jgi:hypothetical protein